MIFHHTMEVTNSQMQVESACRAEPNAVALHGPGGFENIILITDSQKLSVRNRMSEDVARSELEAMERDARFVFFFTRSAIQHRSPRKPKTGKRCRYQVVKESSEN